jgi:hypothetical protein
LLDDISELSGTLSNLLALSRRADDKKLFEVLNRNPAFWNANLLALETSSFVVIGRVHDTSRNAYLNSIRKFVKGHKSLNQFEGYWRDLATTAEALESVIFAGRNYGPKLDIDMINTGLRKAGEAWDRLALTEDRKSGSIEAS